MNPLAPLLEQHVRSHPELELQDAIKFLYQSCMGPGHLGLDSQAVLDRLEAEWADVEGDADAPLTEPLGGGLCRLSLCACKGQGLEPSTLSALFLHTAQTVTPDWKGLEEQPEAALHPALPPGWSGSGSGGLPQEVLQVERSRIGLTLAIRN